MCDRSTPQDLRGPAPIWQISYDHESIPLGQSFPVSYRQAITSADVVLVMIGPKWLQHLLERCEQPTDHVRAKVELALKSSNEVLPVTLGRANIPTEASMAQFCSTIAS